MNESKKFWIDFLLKNLLVLILLVLSSNIFNYIIKNQIAENFTNEIRNDFLLSNHRESNHKILIFLEHNDFLEIRTNKRDFKKNNNLKSIFSFESRHAIYSNPADQESIVDQVIFRYTIVNVTFYAFLVWLLLNFLLILFIPKIKKHLEFKILKKQEVLRAKREMELAIQVSHDIRSPIAALNSIAENLKENTNEYVLLQSTISRINDIANRLLCSNEKELIEIPGYYSVNALISDILLEKRIEYSSINLEIKVQDYVNVLAFLIPSEFKIIISNILNNAIESIDTNPKVTIALSDEENYVQIRISDNGRGIPSFILNTMGKKAITTKPSGNGLGLKHAYSKLTEWGGELSIIETSPKGTIIGISLKKEQVLEGFIGTILIDDDILVRTIWESRAGIKNISFRSYSDVRNFKNDIVNLDKSNIIYIDSELGGIKGEELAVELHLKGFTNLSITSGHHPEKFKQYDFLKSVINKKPPF